MARSRNLKPAFFKNEYLGQLSHAARLLFAGLWCLADRAGRLEDRPLRIKGEIFPFESVNVDVLLNELAGSPEHFIHRYQMDGQGFIQIRNFHKHQNPHHREAESVIPEMISGEPRTSLGNSGTSRADSLNPITDSLTSEAETSASVSVDDENSKYAQEGLNYLISLNSPNHTSIGWIKGYLSIQFKELESSRPDLRKPEILSCWRDVCDLSVAKNKPGPEWIKSVFKNKLDVLTPETLNKPLPDPASREAWEALKSFSFIKHKFTEDLPIPISKAVFKQDDQNNIYVDDTPWPVWMVEGVEEASQ